MTYMKRNFVVAFVVAILTFTNFAAAQESDYSSAWCNQQGGNASGILSDGTKPDCILDDKVVEFDWGKGMKPYECVGQALHYSKMTNKNPVCILIQDNKISDRNFLRAVRKASSGHVEIICVDNNAIEFECP